MTAHRRRTPAVVSAGTALLLVDVTVVNAAPPVIRCDLGASFAEPQWVIDAHALTLAATLPTAGALADRLGSRAIVAAGLFAITLLSPASAPPPAASPVTWPVARRPSPRPRCSPPRWPCSRTLQRTHERVAQVRARRHVAELGP